MNLLDPKDKTEQSVLDLCGEAVQSICPGAVCHWSRLDLDTRVHESMWSCGNHVYLVMTENVAKKEEKRTICEYELTKIYT